MVKILTTILLLLISLTGYCQKVGGWNYVITQSGTGKRPALIFFPGLGEIGTDVNKLTKYGPHALIRMGVNPLPGWIIISLQPVQAYPNEIEIKKRLDSLIILYNIDTTRINLTGLSHGGWCSSTFVSGGVNSINTVITVQGVKPDDNQPYPAVFSNFKGSGYICFEQRLDGRDGQTVVNYINSQRPGIATFIETNFGGGGHCCWDRFYGGNGTQPENFGALQSRDIYSWLIAHNTSGTVALPPIVRDSLRTIKTFYTDGSFAYLTLTKPTFYTIYNALGQAVSKDYLPLGKNKIPITHLPTGVYFLKTKFYYTYKFYKP